MSMNIVKVEDLDVSKIKLSKINVNKYGGKSLYLNYDGSKTPLYLRLPTMMAPFGMNKWEDENNKDRAPTYTLALSFNGMDNNERLKKCYDKLVELDNLMVDLGVKHSKEWFKKKKSKAVVEDNYNSMIRQDDEKKWPAKINKINVRYVQNENSDGEKTGKFVCNFFDKNKEDFRVTDKDDIPSKTKITPLIKCRGVYLIGSSKFGLSWDLAQAKITPPSTLNRYALGDDSDCDEEDVTEIPVDNNVDDSESSSDESDDSD